MKKLSAVLMLILTMVSGRAALPQPDLLVSAYFAGAQKISATPNSKAFANEFCSAPAQTLRTQTAHKLSLWLAGWLQANNAVTVPDGAARLRPLFDDLQNLEWMLEIQAAEGGKPEAALAIKLDGEQNLAWQTALKPFFPAASFTLSGGWLIFDSGTGTTALGKMLAQKIATPPADLFDLDINWPRLARWLPELNKLGLPETAFKVTAQDTNFHITGNFYYSAPLSLNLDTWRFPTNLIHEPFISFTAVRGFASWLQNQDWLQSFQVVPPLNQAFIWAKQGMPFQTYAALPVPNATSALGQINDRLQPFFNSVNLGNISLFKYSLHESNNLITLVGVPMIAPYIQAMHDSSGQFLFAGGFPPVPRGLPIPSKLFERLATPNIVFYHWEITSDRIPLMLQPVQLGLLASGHYQLSGNAAAFRWLTNTAPLLGPTDTEITQTAPDQLAFNRTAPGIFTSDEFYVLANWLEATNFPGCDLRSPPIRKSRGFHPMAPIAIPTPAAK
jgi:hypothetical protein